MEKTVLVLASIFLLASTPMLHAEAVYLSCVCSNGEKTWKEFVKVDEDSGKITHTTDDKSYNVEGFFSPTKIKYKYLVSQSTVSDSTMYRVFVIDRTTLDITISPVEKFHSEPLNEEIAKLRLEMQSFLDSTKIKGSCEIVEVKNRKI